MKKKFDKKYLIGILVAGAILLVSLAVTFIKSDLASNEYNGAEKVYISLDEFVGWKALLYANGGLVTTEDSINAKNGICIEYVGMNDAAASSNALISGELKGAGYTVNRYAFLQSKFDEAGVEVIMPFISNYSNGADGFIVTSDILSIEDLVG